jgi:hypothetical protein
MTMQTTSEDNVSEYNRTIEQANCVAEIHAIEFDTDLSSRDKAAAAYSIFNKYAKLAEDAKSYKAAAIFYMDVVHCASILSEYSGGKGYRELAAAAIHAGEFLLAMRMVEKDIDINVEAKQDLIATSLLNVAINCSRATKQEEQTTK